jgi:hypothetical protein
MLMERCRKLQVTHLLFSEVGKHILCAHKVLTGVNQILRKMVLEGLVV